MKQAMVEHSSSASHSFLLDDDSTLPFAANDILAQMDDKVCGLCELIWDNAVRTFVADDCLQHPPPHTQALAPLQGTSLFMLSSVLFLCLQDLYVGLPVPDSLKQAGDGATSFAFLEKELRFSSM